MNEVKKLTCYVRSTNIKISPSFWSVQYGSEFSIETPYWSRSDGHQHGGRKLKRKAFGIDFLLRKRLVFSNV